MTNVLWDYTCTVPKLVCCLKNANWLVNIQTIKFSLLNKLPLNSQYLTHTLKDMLFYTMLKIQELWDLRAHMHVISPCIAHSGLNVDSIKLSWYHLNSQREIFVLTGILLPSDEELLISLVCWISWVEISDGHSSFINHIWNLKGKMSNYMCFVNLFVGLMCHDISIMSMCFSHYEVWFFFLNFIYFNSSRPNESYMHQQTRNSGNWNFQSC